jgi:hypothetical protein
MQTDVSDDLPCAGLIQATTLECPDDYDLPTMQALAARVPGVGAEIRQARRERLARLAASFRALRPEARDAARASYAARVAEILESARACVTTEAIRCGRVPEIRVVARDLAPNQILRNFWEDLFARFKDTAGVNQTLAFQYLALGTSYAQTLFAQPDLHAEAFRKAPEQIYEDGISTIYATLLTNRTEYNPPETTVASATADSITLTSATGFASFQRLQIETANAIYKTTITLAGSVAQCSDITGGDIPVGTSASEFPEDDIPQAGDAVYVLVAEGGVIIGEDATATLGTGKPMNRRRLETKKQGYPLLWDFIFKGASIDT